MAQEMPITPRDILAKLLAVLEKVEGDTLRFKETLAALQSIHRTSSVDDLGDLLLDDANYRNLFHLLATCLNEARILKADHLSEAFTILADISRERKRVLPADRLWLMSCSQVETSSG